MLKFLVSILVLVCGAIPASATLTTYTDLSTFTANTANQTFQNITFPATISGAGYTDPTTGVVFSDAGGGTVLKEITAPGTWPADSSLQATACSSSPGSCVTTLTVTLPTAVTSVSLYLGLQDTNPFQVTVSDSAVACGTNTSDCYNHGLTQANSSTPYFFGVTGTAPFTTFTIATESWVDNLTIDDLEIGTADAQTPEIATFLMIGSGLIMLRCGRRWLPRVS